LSRAHPPVMAGQKSPSKIPRRSSWESIFFSL
jgi:hypothetical protein